MVRTYRLVRAVPQADSGTSFYSITSSARPIKEDGTTRPSQFAVLRLMTSSKRAGCSIGISPANSPLSAFLINRADWRHMSCTLGPYDINPPASTNSLKLKTVAICLRIAKSANSRRRRKNVGS
jgi:hypothetical protein